jgi:predicted dehydrogenase
MIGCGGMGRYVTTDVLKQSPQLELRGLCDPDQHAIDATRERAGVDAPRFDTHQAMLRSDAIDWVMIASWNCFHREHVVAAARAGKKIFCQKPLATTMTDALAMQRAVKGTRRPFSMGFNLRYSPHYVKVRELVRSGAVGNVISLEFNETLAFNHGGYIMGDWRRLRSNAGTHLLEKCCHDIDLANWILGSLATRVASFGGLDFFLPKNRKHMRRLGKDKNGKEAYRTWGGPIDRNPFTSNKDIMDNQVAIIEYANGVRATFHTNCNSGIPERRMYIVGTEGCIRADVIPGTIQVQRVGFDTAIEDVDTEGAGGHGGGDAILACELADTMLNGSKPRATMIDGLKSAVTCFAIDKATDSGRVVDVRPYWKRAGIKVR